MIASSQRIVEVLLVVLLACALPSLAWAGALPPVSIPAGTCTTDPQFGIAFPAPGTGIVSIIVAQVQTILNTVWNTLYISVISNPRYQIVIKGALTLYFIIYATLFTFGMVNMTLYEFVIRMTKIGIVAALISPVSFAFFAATVYNFFGNGTDALINASLTIAVGTAPGIFPAAPFSVVDNGLIYVTSARMAVTLIALLFTGPYGLIFGLLIVLAAGTFIKALFEVVWVYLMSLVVRALLFGLAPIFIIFILFARTRHIFDGWLNQIINASLQPVFLFTFFAFYAVLIQAALIRIMNTPVCWSRMKDLSRGGPTEDYYWRFANWNPVKGVHEPTDAAWSWWGATGAIVPISVPDILIFLVLAQLALKFNTMALSAAQQIAGASTELRTMGSLGEWFSGEKLKQAVKSGGDTKLDPVANQRAAARGRPAARRNAGGQVNNSRDTVTKNFKNVVNTAKEQGFGKELNERLREMVTRR